VFQLPAFTKKIRILMKEIIVGFVGFKKVAPLIRHQGYAY